MVARCGSKRCRGSLRSPAGLRRRRCRGQGCGPTDECRPMGGRKRSPESQEGATGSGTSGAPSHRRTLGDGRREGAHGGHVAPVTHQTPARRLEDGEIRCRHRSAGTHGAPEHAVLGGMGRVAPPRGPRPVAWGPLAPHPAPGPPPSSLPAANGSPGVPHAPEARNQGFRHLCRGGQMAAGGLPCACPGTLGSIREGDRCLTRTA